MMDNTEKIDHTDKQQINIHEYYEVEYWTKAFGISAEELKKAVTASGTSVEAVKKYLGI